MPTDHRARLACIRRFDQLVAYLRDELGWPIDSEDFEELTFDYTPEELGIDAKNAAKIQEIKRLRPLVTGQPWGIFFVKFEPKRLPVVALRRILGQVALKKRASANKSERQAWAADDLLFVSNYGEGKERRIAFAHFSKPQDGHDLPTLKVLGWDNLDTALHLDAVARELTDHLTWPEDEGDPDAWRQQWRAAFKLRHREVITTSKQLSKRLAELAGEIRDRTRTTLAIETEAGPLTKLMKAFQTGLVHDLDETGFADMYAQTIAYGLLSARITDPARRTADDLAAHMRTNPFLKELMETFLHLGGRRGRAGGPGIDFDELGVSEVVELLDQANMEVVVRDFGDRNPQEDPVIHFYEHFLAAYDKKQKVSRGVFYTPRSVVSYIVRSVDMLLRTEFGLTDGLADTTSWGEMAKRHKELKIPEGTSPSQAFVQILDPATGTGTFLVEVIDLIHRTMVEKWTAQGHGEKKIQARWNDYVPNRLLARLNGYELLMAPYAIAHLKIGLKLYETGYRFKSDARAQVYLTNALEPPGSGQLTFDFLPALAHEAAAVNEIKQKKRFTVVIGNPPYRSISLNRGGWIRKLVDDYLQLPKGPMKERGNRNQLQDDYVKFYRLAHRLTRTTGVVGVITNSSYLRGPWFRGMRYQLLRTFREISILDLHGAQSHSLDSHESDQNVFEITTPVAIALLRTRSSDAPKRVRYAEIVGQRQAKYDFLSSHTVLTVASQDLTPDPRNQWRLLPHDSTGLEEWSQWLPLSEFFNSWGAGVLTNRNGLAVDVDRRILMKKICRFANIAIPDSVIEKDYRFSSNYQWKTGRARRIFASQDVQDLAEQYTFRPFDVRWIYWHKNIVYNMRGDKMEVFRQQPPSIGLMFSRNTKHSYYSNVYVTRHIADRHCLEDANVAPLYIPEDEGLVAAEALSNLSTRAADVVAKIGLRLRQESHGDLVRSCGTQDLMSFVYAVLHSNDYRRRYLDFLKIDFARVPLAESVDLFRKLVAFGHELMALHLLESPQLDMLITAFTGPKNPEVGRVGWSEGTVWLDARKTNARERHRAIKPGTVGFKGVPEEVWDFHIGGYQVCHKWLKDRKGRTLSDEEVAHYQKFVVALNETICIMAEVDDAIEAHGGWPDAFQTGSEADAASEGTPKVVPFRPPTVEPTPEDRYITCVPLVPLKAAAGAFSDPQHIDDDFEWVAVESRHRLRKGMFVARVVGESMEPAIRDGSWCLFRAPVEGSRQGKFVLVQLRDATDPETGQRYTVKRYKSIKAKVGHSWRHVKIILEPVNPDFEPIVLTSAEEGEFQVIAELVEVLEREASFGGD